MNLAFALSFGADLYYILVWFRNHHREHFRSVLNAQLSIVPLSERLFWWRKACISTKLTFSHQSAVNNSNFSLGHTHTHRVLIDLALTLNCFHQETIKWKTHVDTWPATHGQRTFFCVVYGFWHSWNKSIPSLCTNKAQIKNGAHGNVGDALNCPHTVILPLQAD